MSLEGVGLGAPLLGATVICVGRAGPWSLGRKVPWLSQDEVMGAEVCDVEVARGLVATERDGVVTDLSAWAHAAVCKRDTPMGVFFGLG